MTADHPTREERYAAVLMAHLPGDYTHLFDADPASTPPEQTVRCRCGWRGPGMHAAHVATALVAADPAPAQPDAAWPCDNHGEPNTCLSLRKAEAECCRVCRIRAADRILHAAQPDAAPERKDMAWDNLPAPEVWHDTGDAQLPESDWQPVPAPEVSRGVAEVKAEALREAADEIERMWSPFGWSSWTADESEGARVFRVTRQALRDRADRIVRDALPADDGAEGGQA